MSKNKTKSEKKVEYLVKKGKEFSSNLRKNATKWELQFFRMLKDCHIYFKFQHPVICNKKHLYILDFYLPDINYTFELNGSQHYTPENRKKDRIRKRNLKKEGILLLEFANKQISTMTKENLLQIYNSLIVKNE